VHELADLNSHEWVRSITYALRRLPEGAQEATAHPLAITQTGCAGDLFDRQAALIEHEPGGFKRTSWRSVHGSNGGFSDLGDRPSHGLEYLCDREIGRTVPDISYVSQE
jgi:hypothetical protein